MIVFPHAKINIGLSVTGKRNDGFHDIETVFYPIQLCDTLKIDPLETAVNETVASGKLKFSLDGIALPDNGLLENLCCKAFLLLDADYRLPPVHIHLHKRIPVGAGLGGGSSDAAYTLKALNDVFQLRIPDEKMIMYASHLGSDCTFFLQHRPAWGIGKGDILNPLDLSLSDYHIILVKPPVSVRTADAYTAVVPRKPTNHLPELLQTPISEWRHTVFNDFENSIFQKFPEIKQIKERLYQEGAVYASMSGSGSCVYGFFKRNMFGIDQSFPDCWAWNCEW